MIRASHNQPEKRRQNTAHLRTVKDIHRLRTIKLTLKYPLVPKHRYMLHFTGSLPHLPLRPRDSQHQLIPLCSGVLDIKGEMRGRGNFQLPQAQ